MQNQPDRRNWSFAKRALSEQPKQQQQAAMPKPKPKTRPYVWWAIIKLTNGQYYKYQFSKDIQAAIKHDSLQQAKPYLINSLIVVPTSEFYRHPDGKRYADMTVGQIVFIFKQPKTSNPRWITRGQLCHTKLPIWSPDRFDKTYNYLKHDYDQNSQATIKQAIKKLAHYNGTISVLEIIAAIILIVIMLYLELHFHIIPIVV